MNEVAARRSSRWTLPAMVLVFAAPVLAAWFFYFNPEYLPSTRSNKGELIQPLIVLADTAELRTMDGAPFDLEQLKGTWTLVSINAAPCDEDCRQRAIGLRQIRLALGETRFSVERLLLLDGPADTAALAAELDGMHIAMLQGGEAGKLLAALNEGDRALNRTYILDPMGNLMMRYAADAPPKDPLKDMERLLKASKNWIKGASYGHR
jgi:hypothetical protein